MGWSKIFDSVTDTITKTSPKKVVNNSNLDFSKLERLAKQSVIQINSLRKENSELKATLKTVASDGLRNGSSEAGKAMRKMRKN